MHEAEAELFFFFIYTTDFPSLFCSFHFEVESRKCGRCIFSGQTWTMYNCASVGDGTRVEEDRIAHGGLNIDA